MRYVALILVLGSGVLASSQEAREVRYGMQAGVLEPKGYLGTLQKEKSGGSIGLHALVPVGPIFLRPRMDMHYFRSGNADQLHARQALLAGLDVVGGWKGQSRGFMTSFGFHAVRWELESASGPSDVTHVASSIGIGWRWNRSTVELRYLNGALDRGRSADVLEMGVSFHF